jgi:hypothetical protein
MSSVAISGNASGAGVLTIAAPNTASNYTLTLPTATTTLVGTDATQTLTNKTLTSPTITGAVVSTMASSVITSGTAVATTSGTSKDYTSIPSWVKRITVIFNGVSLSGTANYLIQPGTGGTPTNTGYVSNSVGVATAGSPAVSSTSGFIIYSASAAKVCSGNIIITNISGNIWVISGNLGTTGGAIAVIPCGGVVTLGGVLDNLRITTTNGTDTFTAGSINILYE